LENYLVALVKSKKNLLIYRNDEIIFSSEARGVKPLIEAIDELGPKRLKGVVTADRVVGKAAALLNVYMKAREIHALIISNRAEKFLQDNGCQYFFRERVDAIKTENGEDLCPFEKLVWDIGDPREAYMIIKDKLTKLKANGLGG
jgi:hypothetical protein